MKSRLALILILLSVLASCRKETDTQNCTIHFANEQKDVWSAASKDATATSDFYYVLDANGLCQTAAYTNHGEAGSFDKLLSLGGYSAYCITNIDPSGLPFTASMIGTNFTNQAMVINTLTDVSFGQQPLAIVASQTNYDINVPVSHIMAKLALSIAGVPADIDAIAVTAKNLFSKVGKVPYLHQEYVKVNNLVLELQNKVNE